MDGGNAGFTSLQGSNLLEQCMEQLSGSKNRPSAGFMVALLHQCSRDIQLILSIQSHDDIIVQKTPLPRVAYAES